MTRHSRRRQRILVQSVTNPSLGQSIEIVILLHTTKFLNWHVHSVKGASIVQMYSRSMFNVTKVHRKPRPMLH